MRSFKKIKLTRRHGKFALFFCLAFLMAQCFTIVSVDQPTTATAGSTINVTLQAEIVPAFDLTDMRLVTAVLVPKSWSAGANTTITFTSNKGNGTMSLIPSNVTAPSSANTWPQEIRTRVGIGGNLIDEVEWVAFWSDQTYNVTANESITGTVTINMKVGPQNTISQVGYLIGESTIDLTSTNNYSTYFPDCFKVTDGAGVTIDFCNPQIATVAPIKSLDNDIITMNFDASVGPTALSGKDKVYLCATGYVDGTPIALCDRSAGSAMVNGGGDTWSLNLWPRRYFNLAEGQTLERIEYSFTDETGAIVVPSNPLTYEFSCD